jgi:hypothetical protein
LAFLVYLHIFELIDQRQRRKTSVGKWQKSGMEVQRTGTITAKCFGALHLYAGLMP